MRVVPTRNAARVLAFALLAPGSVLAVLMAGGGTVASPGVTTRVSVDSAGNPGNGDSGYAAISADSRYTAFSSSASNLVPGDTNGSRDIFVHDSQTGSTTRASVDSAGNQANGPSAIPEISADGRYIVFCSDASNLVPGDTNSYWDVFVYDRQTGATTRVSVSSGGNQGTYGGCCYFSGAVISADGRYVAFESGASNMVPGDTNGIPDIFVRDRQTGVTERVSVDSAGNQGNGYSWWAAISADGRYVAFYSEASNLVPGDTNGAPDVFVRDRQTGTTTRVSVDSAGNQANGSSAKPAMSADGRYTGFSSSASNLVPGDTNAVPDIFVHDSQTGTTTRVSVDSAGNQANQSSEDPAISADGRYVAFSSSAWNLVPGDTAYGPKDIFVHDCAPPPTPTPTFTPTATRTFTPTPTNTFTPTPTNTYTPTPTITPTPTNTYTPTPTITPTPTSTWTPTPTNTYTPTPTFTPVPPTPTFTPTPTNTYTPTPTNTFTPTSTSTYTPTSTITPTPTNTFTPTPVPPTATFSPTPAYTFTPTPTKIFTPTSTPTPPPHPPGVGGTVKLPPAAVAAESGAAAEGSGWGTATWAALAGSAVAIGIGGWYARRRWLR